MRIERLTEGRVSRLWNSPRAVGILWLIGIIFLSFLIVFFMTPRMAVDYKSVVLPIHSDLCPGDDLNFSIVVEIVDYPEVVTISENWCHAGENGACSNTLAKTRQMPLAAYRQIAGSPSVPIPVSPFFEKPGPYEYWHVAVDGKSDGYIVPFTIRADCPAIEP